jgi:hypothetical protein
MARSHVSFVAESVVDLESIDLSEATRHLRRACGRAVIGDVRGRERIRDELVKLFGCSEPDALTVLDALIQGGHVARVERRDGMVEWSIVVPDLRSD